MRDIVRIVFLSATLFFGFARAAEPEKPVTSKHSLAELGYLIGKWTCHVTVLGKPEARMTAVYEWIYDGKVLKETIDAPGYSGTFFTTYEASTDKFKGVAVGNDGGYIVWENAGMVNGKSSETGYVFNDGKLIPASRTEGEKINNDHYIIRDYAPDTQKGPGALTDTEDCTKTS